MCPNMLFSNSMILLTHDQLLIHYKSQVTQMEACHEPSAAYPAIVQLNILVWIW